MTFRLVYEIFFTNFTRGDAVPTTVEVLDAATGSAVATLDAAAITERGCKRPVATHRSIG